MKVIVLHGDDIGKSYARLKKFIDVAKKRNWEILYDQISPTPSLFGQDRLTIVRDTSLINKKELARASGTIVIYNEGEINKNFLKNLPEGTKIEEFKLPKLIWNFLENIRPANGEKIIRDFHRIIENEPPELVFSLIAKQFHDLYRVKISPNSRNFPLWKIGKLKSQAKYFSLEELKALIAKLAEIDIEVKTGRAELAPSLDVLFLKRLE